ncbi:hypothetical protein Hanom_Chr02g00171191 [Helianthus anomalus]
MWSADCRRFTSEKQTSPKSFPHTLITLKSSHSLKCSSCNRELQIVHSEFLLTISLFFFLFSSLAFLDNL